MGSKAKRSPNAPLQLELSRNDPLDASYFLSCNSYARSDASDSKTRRPLYIVSTSHASSSGAGPRITTIDRILSPEPQLGGFNRSNTRSRRALRPSPLANVNNASTQAQPRSYWSNSSASSSSGSDKISGRIRVATITRPAPRGVLPFQPPPTHRSSTICVVTTCIPPHLPKLEQCPHCGERRYLS